MKSNKMNINPEYENLFVFENDSEKIEHDAQMISYRILSEVERICELRNLKRKDLAVGIGRSQSFITQLFRGNKSINTNIMAKFENFLDISFEVRSYCNNMNSEVNWFNGNNYMYLKSCIAEDSSTMNCNSDSNSMDNYVDKLTTENYLIQTAA